MPEEIRPKGFGTDESPPQSTRINRRTAAFREMFAQLPATIQELAIKAFQEFVRNPAHPALRLHALKDTDKGSHAKGSKSVSVNLQSRAIYVEVGDRNVWYWIGTHAAYNRFTGKI